MTILALLAGTFYGLVIGIIPSAGATTGLVAMFSFISVFAHDPYLGVIFCMAVVAASTTGDTYSGVLLGIPGANSAAATMVDGFPLAKQGKATYAITAAVTTSTVNGILWGFLVFAFLPFYVELVMYLGVPELWGLLMLAMATVGFVSNKYWFRSLIAIGFGLFLGMIGVDPTTNADRLTFGWGYLADSIQIMPMVAGLYAFPELIDGLKTRNSTAKRVVDELQQTKDGIWAAWKYKWDALRGGAIGAIIGFLPGLGGAMCDWMAYGSTVAANPNEEFGNGNIRGVIGPEGANNAQKATSMIPTVLFGIPGASFAAVLMALFTFLGFELGTPDLVYDTKFFDSMVYGFMWATILVAIICIFATKYIARITLIPYRYYFPLLVVFVIWACVQYTGGWEDYAILFLCSVIGICAKKYKFSRPALLLAFILSDKIEKQTLQVMALYDLNSLVTRPIFMAIMIAIILTALWGIRKQSKIDYA